MCEYLSRARPAPTNSPFLLHDYLERTKRSVGLRNRIKQRYKQINHFEKMLSQNGTAVLKFFLHIDKDEQKRRLEERLKDPRKNWKFNINDLNERKLWNDYGEAYERALEECSTDEAPWYVVPANKKWFRNLVVSEIINKTLDKMDLKLPKSKADLSKIKVV